MKEIKEIDRFKGCMVGLAIGDALGLPTEFMSPEEIKKEYGEKGVQGFQKLKNFPIGTYSDDTQMSLAIAEALTKSNDSSLEEIMRNIVREFITWYDSPDNNRAPGNTCLTAAKNLKAGVSWRESGIRESKGCGAAMRTAPIGLFFNKDLEKLVEVARASSFCTHAHPTGVSAGIGTAYAVYLAFHSHNPDTILWKLENNKFGNHEFEAKIRQMRKVLKTSPEEAAGNLGKGFVGEEAVALALYCFLRSPEDYRKSVLTAANIGGDTDSIACITGAMSGAYNGIQAIPQEWVDRVENSRKLQDISNELNKKSPRGKSFLIHGKLIEGLFALGYDVEDGWTRASEMSDQQHLIERTLKIRTYTTKPVKRVYALADMDRNYVTVVDFGKKSLHPKQVSPRFNQDLRKQEFKSQLFDYLSETQSPNVLIVRSNLVDRFIKETKPIFQHFRYNLQTVESVGFNEQLGSH